jgi:hypothetical protein
MVCRGAGGLIRVVVLWRINRQDGYGDQLSGPRDMVLQPALASNP